jgi:hypothetical protein
VRNRCKIRPIYFIFVDYFRFFSARSSASISQIECEDDESDFLNGDDEILENFNEEDEDD